MRVVIQHRSRYVYPQPARLGPQLIRLRPADHARAVIERYQLAIEPEHRLHWQRDPNGNHVARVTFKAGQTITALDVVVELAVDIRPINPFDFLIDDRVKRAPFRYPDELDAELAPYLDTGDPAYRMGRRATELLAALPASGDTLDLLVALNARVRERVAYVIRDEPGVWTPEETLGHGRGSCRDAAVLLVALMRARGIAARFVSGYLVQLTDEGMIPDEPRGVDRDVVDLHAWAEAYLPGAGWIGFDGTSGLLCGEGHIPLAATASPSHAAPLDGTSDVAASEVRFSTHIARLGHEARPTAPYPDEVWAELEAGGDRADAALAAAGLEVWIGGEPTFTARAGQDRPEWQGGALGPDKWQRGRRLARELRDRLAPGGVILHRTGKHYPGESLPRWALDVIARRGGPPLWPERAARSAAVGRRRRRRSRAGPPRSASSWRRRSASRASCTRRSRTRGRSCAPRPACRSTSTRGPPASTIRRSGAGWPGSSIAAPAGAVGWVLPLARDAARDAGWRTERWKLRRDHLFLIWGDSPIGLRLPLGSITGAEPPVWAEAPDLPDPRRDPPPAPGGRRGASPSRADTAEQSGARPRRLRRRATRAGPDPLPGSAPRWRSSRATASSGCSCRRSRGSTTSAR